MSRYLLLPLFLVAIAFSGCAFNRADFVSDANGKPNQEEMSDTGKTVGSWLRWGPNYRMTF